ncbi:queuosine-tRNA galactosyltransferase isoform X2 [Salmo salar]|uniref:Queuosine-tRNA galactosyltransferase isoform X2 n=1 Tax=Salmo salar TaxID=8030 RepID=A0ABM3E476_SALSA|nr:UDP-GlcNAc:betaGal beta-1,3-N-acetylglucosaminyltransferase-like protein 1 isoform X2 [Salmo salar]|eukprot:XP_014037358.1 PREDICTED: UDP-GlcNAc:betaGal beta-1,3-N-acetylglucosaminyltransferase-like protein 1 isoform X2 [Salmo salar]
MQSHAFYKSRYRYKYPTCAFSVDVLSNPLASFRQKKRVFIVSSLFVQMNTCSLAHPNGQEADSVPAKRLCKGECVQDGSVGGGGGKTSRAVEVSIVMPVHNASCWLDECLQGILNQDYTGSMELSVYDDASTDSSRAIVEGWRERLERRGVSMVISGHDSAQPRGVGHAKNQAVSQSSGTYLCFQDADDVMMPQRIHLQYEACLFNSTSLIGCQVRRDPEGSTERYTRWINNISQDQLSTQGVPEDLLWFYQSVGQGGGVVRVDQCLLVYRYHQQAATHSVLEETIWNLRVAFLQERVINQWESFTIWNAGKQGRKLYRCLSSFNQKKVLAFCDVDENKIKKGFYTYEESKERPKPQIPVLHYRDASPPYIICVKLDMTGGVFEENLKSLHLEEGVDYYHFN